MRFLAHALLALLFVLPIASASAQDTAQPHPFAHAGVAKDGERYEAYLKANWKAAGTKATELRQAGEKVLGSDQLSIRARRCRDLTPVKGTGCVPCKYAVSLVDCGGAFRTPNL